MSSSNYPFWQDTLAQDPRDRIRFLRPDLSNDNKPIPRSEVSVGSSRLFSSVLTKIASAYPSILDYDARLIMAGTCCQHEERSYKTRSIACQVKLRVHRSSSTRRPLGEVSHEASSSVHPGE